VPGIVYHLIGRPGVGKYTIGSELARQTGARLVDNHSIANVIFQLLDIDGVTPLPNGVWARVRQVREAVLDTLATLAPPELSFVFTNFVRGEDEAEYAYFMQLVVAAEARGSVFVPVVLSCQTSELVRRIVQPERRLRMKLVDPVEGARLNDSVPQFRTDHPNLLELDVTAMGPVEAAETIARWGRRLSGGMARALAPEN
jgi:hypothetical protein